VKDTNIQRAEDRIKGNSHGGGDLYEITTEAQRAQSPAPPQKAFTTKDTKDTKPHHTATPEENIFFKKIF